jgi:hypothetical protein
LWRSSDTKGVIQIFNVGAERMLGYAASEVINTITPADISALQTLTPRPSAPALRPAGVGPGSKSPRPE